MAAIETRLATDDAARTGRRLAWLGYLTIVASIGGWIAVNWSRSGHTPTILAVIAMVGAWGGSAGVAYGDLLRARLGPDEAIRPRSGFAALPLMILLAIFYRSLDTFSPWWLLSLPTLTYELVQGVGVPQWPALALTAVLALPELAMVIAVWNVVIVKLAQLVFGRRNPVVELIRGIGSGVDTAGDAPTGRHRWNPWVGQAVAASG
jgi:hypothetical protein